MAGAGRRISEKRKSRRLAFHADAFLGHEDVKFSGEIRNIGGAGAYIATNGPYSVGEQVELNINFRHNGRRLSMELPCKIARVDGAGVGLVCSRLDPNQLLQLELIFDLNKDHTRSLMEEFCKVI